MAAKTRSSRGGDKRERILTAAVKVFAAHGFYNAKISQIAAEAGVADGTIYLYFKNKDDLLISAFEDVMSQINQRISSEIDGLDNPLDKLRRYIRMHVELAQTHGDLAEFITVELRQSAKFIKEYKNPKFGEYLGILRAVLVEGQERGVIRRDLDARFVARSLFGALDETLLTVVLSKRRRSPEELDNEVAQLEELFIGGLQPAN